jgi:signal peptidase I
MKWGTWARIAVAAAAAGALAVLGLRAFVGDVFLVDSRSMEPVLHGDPKDGDRVFVRFEERPPLHRFDLVVIARPGERVPVVKRVAGLAGETVLLSGGDLYVGGALLSSEVRHAPWVLIFDTKLQPFPDIFHFDRARWVEREGLWRVDGRGARGLFAKLRARILDDYLLPSGQRAEGRAPVNDAALELELRPQPQFGHLLLRLSEEGDLFWVELVRTETGRARAKLLRGVRTLSGDGPPETLGATEFDFEPAQWHTLRFSNRDNELCFDVDGREGLLRHRYLANTPSQRTPEGGTTHALPRAEFGGDDLDLELRRARLERDTTWFSLGRFATSDSLVLGADEIFVLGDNSAESRDSRDWGPIPLSSVIGTPHSVVWPRPRARDL